MIGTDYKRTNGRAVHQSYRRRVATSDWPWIPRMRRNIHKPLLPARLLRVPVCPVFCIIVRHTIHVPVFSLPNPSKPYHFPSPNKNHQCRISINNHQNLLLLMMIVCSLQRIGASKMNYPSKLMKVSCRRFFGKLEIFLSRLRCKLQRQ